MFIVNCDRVRLLKYLPKNGNVAEIGVKCPSGDFMSRMNRLSGGPS